MKKRIPAAKAFDCQQTEDSEQLELSDDLEILVDEELEMPIEVAEDTTIESEVAEAGTIESKKLSPSRSKYNSSNQMQLGNIVTSEELQLEKEPLAVRETGFWRWKRVIVPPNAYVVHTRMGRGAPITLGLGKSFRYNPETDAYLVVPAAMQTIGVVAKSVTQEKQGINILAYVQWQIDDFSIAYRRLDFSDSRDPLGIVNAQLGEQAEAAIKDKIATMTVEEVLADKAPVIEELTTRLKAVTEGRNHQAGTATAQEGLGIKIVTVQIREAFVSSQKLWQDLQAPFRHQLEKKARISQLTMQNEIHQKDLENHQLTESREAETLAAIEYVKQAKQTEALSSKLTQQSIRSTKELEAAVHKIKIEEETATTRQNSEQRLQAQQLHIEHETQLAGLQQEHEKILEQAKLGNEANNSQKTLETEQALHALAEETRLAEAKMRAEQLRLELDTLVKKQEAALKLLIQEQDDLLEAKTLEGRLTRQRQTHNTEMELEEASNQIKMALQKREVEIVRLEQDIRNMIKEPDLLRRLIDKSAEIAAEMPDIQELKVLQTGNGDMTFEAFSTFVAKILAVAENLGIPLNHLASDKRD